MKDVEYFYFTLPPDIWRKKPHSSSHKMTREQAAKRYPGAEPILSSREVRRLPDTEAEVRAVLLVEYPQYRKRES
jgi:hypothetical protein